jgi:tRNA nucleotidyltransferase (CCA-adding enzyme)
MIKAFQNALPILEQIEDAGYEAYFVGGSVRDSLLNKEIDDVDIATSATPAEIKEIFPKTVDVGIEHGTVLVLYKGQTYEITTFRSESDYEDFRRPKKVKFIRSLFEDLNRRDFTMNAIAMDRKGNLIDPFDGHEAIKKKLIQTVGKAEERFFEDALRIMRAVRFVSQLTFSIEGETFEALKKNSTLLENISIERKTKEFEKLLCGKNRIKAMQLLREAKLHCFLPGLRNEEEALKKIGQFACSDLKVSEMWTLLIFTLKVTPKENVNFLKGWKLSNQKIKEIEKMAAYLQQRLSTDWDVISLYHAGENVCISVERIYNVIHSQMTDVNIDKLKEKYNHLIIKDRSELAVTGQDLMSWNNEPGGPWLREILEKIEQAVLLGEAVNDKESIREWRSTCNPK